MTFTDDQSAAILESLRAGVPLDRAAKAVRATVATVREHAASDEGFAADLAAAEAECAAINAPPKAMAAVRDVKAEWAALAARSEEIHAAAPVAIAAPHKARTPLFADDDEGAPMGAERALAEAAAIAPGRLGSLLWIDDRCQSMRPGLFPLDRQWVEMFAAFYASGKMKMVCRKGLRAAGSASACRALVRNALFAPRVLDAGTVGVIPLMSATREEATDRFVTIRAILQACGISPKKDDLDDVRQPAPNGIGGTFWSTKSLSGGGVIKLRDLHGHDIEFRILPALVRHSVGYTGIAGFLDESDLWLDDPNLEGELKNPADIVFERIDERFTTQPTAELFIFSASYKSDSAHARTVKLGDTPLQFLARLGDEGARIDTAARRGCAELHGLTDPRMTAAGDPTSPDIPCWVGNPSVADIESCYRVKNGDVKKILALYGGRASEAPTGGPAPWTVDQYDALALANDRMGRPVRDPSRRGL